MRGVLIGLEGCDHSGKSTQSVRLVNFLNNNGYRAELLSFPNRSTSIGMIIDEYMKGKHDLDDHAIHLLFSANRWELDATMRTKLNSGITLIVDRYVYSGRVYSMAKGLDEDWCRSSDLGLIRPDRIFYLDVDLKDLERGDFGKERYEMLSFQEKVQKLFSSIEDSRWQIVDGRRSVDKIHTELCINVIDTISKCNDKPLGEIFKVWGYW